MPRPPPVSSSSVRGTRRSSRGGRAMSKARHAQVKRQDEKLRRYPRVSRYAGKLAAAVKVLLEMTEVEPDLSLDMMWDLIENTATKSELRAAVAVIDELFRSMTPNSTSSASKSWPDAWPRSGC